METKKYITFIINQESFPIQYDFMPIDDYISLHRAKKHFYKNMQRIFKSYGCGLRSIQDIKLSNVNHYNIYIQNKKLNIQFIRERDRGKIKSTPIIELYYGTSGG